MSAGIQVASAGVVENFTLVNPSWSPRQSAGSAAAVALATPRTQMIAARECMGTSNDSICDMGLAFRTASRIACPRQASVFIGPSINDFEWKHLISEADPSFALDQTSGSQPPVPMLVPGLRGPDAAADRGPRVALLVRPADGGAQAVG